MDKVIVLDFGGQYCHLISRRIRDLGVFSEVFPAEISKEELEEMEDLKGIILSGGAASVYDSASPKLDNSILDLDIPILGICYGHQVIAHAKLGSVSSANSGEYGLTEMRVFEGSKLLDGLDFSEFVWMNHGDIVETLPAGYWISASTPSSPVAAFENHDKKIYGVQFHPEVSHTKKGNIVFDNFVSICDASRDWNTKKLLNNIEEEIKHSISYKKAILGLSGGVDSSVAAIILSKVIGKQLTAVYVDTGLMRHKETEFMERVFSKYDLDLRIVHAHERFFAALKGVTDPETKRKIIGKLFIDIFDEIAKEENAEILVQGTIYSDRIESGITKHSSNIKSHHNVGGLPDDMKLTVYEPLRDLYKDEVRKLGREIGLDEEIITRHIFPGPGIAIRIIGEVNPESACIVRKSSHIIEEELKRAGVYEKVWMAFGVLLPIKSVGIQGDSRSYKHPLVVRIIESKDAMTANFAKMPYEILEKISTRITNEVEEVNRVVYDISNKPPSTMEWE